MMCSMSAKCPTLTKRRHQRNGCGTWIKSHECHVAFTPPTSGELDTLLPSNTLCYYITCRYPQAVGDTVVHTMAIIKFHMKTNGSNQWLLEHSPQKWGIVIHKYVAE